VVPGKRSGRRRVRVSGDRRWVRNEPHRVPRMCMLLIAALAIIWNLLGHRKPSLRQLNERLA
jgi:hypothetical protein